MLREVRWVCTKCNHTEAYREGDTSRYGFHEKPCPECGARMDQIEIELKK